MNPFIPRVRRSISPFALQPGNVFGSLVARLAPVLFYRMGETTGTVANAINPGTDDAAITGTAAIGSGLSAATGSSTVFTGEYLQTAASARINSLPELHVAMLVNFSVLQDGHLIDKADDFALELEDDGQLKFTVHFDGLNAVALVPGMVDNAWVWIEAYIGSDQIPHILVNGAENYYIVQTVGIGSRSTSTADLNILSNATQSVKIDADLDEVILFDGYVDLSNIRTLSHTQSLIPAGWVEALESAEWHQVRDTPSCKTDLSWLKECFNYQQKKRGETAMG